MDVTGQSLGACGGPLIQTTPPAFWRPWSPFPLAILLVSIGYMSSVGGVGCNALDTMARARAPITEPALYAYHAC